MIYYLVILLLAVIFIVVAYNYKQTTLYRDDKPYLIRHTLISTPWFSIKLHKLLMSDPATMYDHPWSYISIILWGGYIEHSMKLISDNRLFSVPTKETVATWFPVGSIIFRKASTPHRLELPKDVKFSLSLIITSKKTRDWGFINSPNSSDYTRLSY